MFESKRNQVGDINGDYNKVIQITLSDGEKLVEKLGVLIEPLVREEKKEILILENLIKSKEETLKDKQKIVELQNTEIIRLKTELSEKQKEIEESEIRFSQIFIQNDGNDFSGSKELYPKALEFLAKGDKDAALNTLERHILLEQKKELDREKEQQAKSWLLRADLLKGEDKWGEELSECYEMAVEILPNTRNYLNAANHFSFLNEFDRATNYLEISLEVSNTDEEKMATLGNLGNLNRTKDQLEEAAKCFKKAFQERKEE